MNRFIRLYALILMLVSGISFSTALFAQNKDVKIVAHRGYWNVEGSAQNSIKSLQKAHEVGAYGCEFDVNMTSDGVLVVCHGPQVGDIEDIQKATYAEAMRVKLDNGERLPTLEEYLKAAKKGFKVKNEEGKSQLSKIRLFLEIKPAEREIEEEILTKVAAMISNMKMEERITIISFSLYVCARAAQLLPNVPVQYLMGDRTPKELKEMGIDAIDYHFSLLLLNEQVIKDAHELGMEVNVWTVDDPAQIDALAKMGVDYITTNEPLKAKEILQRP